MEKDLSAVQTELPSFDQNWEKLKNYAPTFLPRDWKQTMDSITTTWRDYKKIYDATTSALRTALALTGIPKEEFDDASKDLKTTDDVWGILKEGIIKVANGDKLREDGGRFTWKDIRKLGDTADCLGRTTSDSEQATALLEAINELTKEGKLPKDFRQKIAQHAFAEIFEVARYRVYDYTAVEDTDDLIQRTTQDSVPNEKTELLIAIRDKGWDEQKIKDMRKIYRAWKRVALSSDNNVEEYIADNLEELWNAAWKGEGTIKKSSLYFLNLAEDTYRGLEDGGAFDIDLNDFQEEGDEEEDEEGN